MPVSLINAIEADFFTVYSFVLFVLYEKVRWKDYVRNLEEKSYYVMRALTKMRLIT